MSSEKSANQLNMKKNTLPNYLVDNFVSQHINIADVN